MDTIWKTAGRNEVGCHTGSDTLIYPPLLPLRSLFWLSVPAKMGAATFQEHCQRGPSQQRPPPPPSAGHRCPNVTCLSTFFALKSYHSFSNSPGHFTFTLLAFYILYSLIHHFMSYASQRLSHCLIYCGFPRARAVSLQNSEAQSTNVMAATGGVLGRS